MYVKWYRSLGKKTAVWMFYDFVLSFSHFSEKGNPNNFLGLSEFLMLLIMKIERCFQLFSIKKKNS